MAGLWGEEPMWAEAISNRLLTLLNAHLKGGYAQISEHSMENNPTRADGKVALTYRVWDRGDNREKLEHYKSALAKRGLELELDYMPKKDQLMFLRLNASESHETIHALEATARDVAREDAEKIMEEARGKASQRLSQSFTAGFAKHELEKITAKVMGSGQQGRA